MRVPILRLGNTLLTSLQTDLTDVDALEFQDEALRLISDTAAVGIAIDISGLDVVDSFMARILNDTSTMVQLLGAEAVVTGMRPTVALTLVEMGRDLLGVKTALNLEDGLNLLQCSLATRKQDS